MKAHLPQAVLGGPSAQAALLVKQTPVPRHAKGMVIVMPTPLRALTHHRPCAALALSRCSGVAVQPPSAQGTRCAGMVRPRIRPSRQLGRDASTLSRTRCQSSPDPQDGNDSETFQEKVLQYDAYIETTKRVVDMMDSSETIDKMGLGDEVETVKAIVDKVDAVVDAYQTVQGATNLISGLFGGDDKKEEENDEEKNADGEEGDGEKKSGWFG